MNQSRSSMDTTSLIYILHPQPIRLNQMAHLWLFSRDKWLAPKYDTNLLTSIFAKLYFQQGITIAFWFMIIAPVYGLFYNKQKKRYREVLNCVATQLNLASYKSILDVGCGTGSLCSILNERGLAVTGVDPAQNMLSIANRQPENKNILFLQANALEQLPFADKSFDLSIASYVAHGMQKSERIKLYSEMRRITKSKVIIYDYN